MSALCAVMGKLPSVVFGPPETPASFVVTQEHAGNEIAYVGDAERAVVWLPELERDSWLIVTNEGGVVDREGAFPRSWLFLKSAVPGLRWEPTGVPWVLANGDSVLIQSV